MDTLAKLFGGQAKIKIMRLFLLNPELLLSVDDIISRSRVQRAGVRREINLLLSINFIKQKFIVESGARGGKKKISAWILNSEFEYLRPIKDLLVDPNLLVQEDLVQKFKPIGKINLMLISGVFIDNPESRVDLMIVGDKIKKNVLSQVIKGLESEIGKELNYVVFDNTEFIYRMNMYDKLVCDILDFPHAKIIDTNKLSTRLPQK